MSNDAFIFNDDTHHFDSLELPEKKHTAWSVDHGTIYTPTQANRVFSTPDMKCSSTTFERQGDKTRRSEEVATLDISQLSQLNITLGTDENRLIIT